MTTPSSLPGDAVQTAIVQTAPPKLDSIKAAAAPLSLAVSHSVPIPHLPAPPGHVLVAILAVALGPNDFKMPMYMPDPGATAGCDYCGIVVATSPADDSHRYKEGDRICGSVFAYNPVLPLDGSFAQLALVDARLALRVPASWTDMQGAALGGVGWTTAALALWGEGMLELQGRPSRPVTGSASEPVLVYGGATASGTMASQLLKLSGYQPIAITSPASASLARQYGAVGTASYLSSSVVEDARQAAAAAAAAAEAGTASGGNRIRHVLDCITTPESHASCMSAIARRGGRYACLEALDQSWPGARKAVKTGVVMAYEMTGHAVDYGDDSAYTRPASAASYSLGVEAAAEMQPLIDSGRVVPHPVRELNGGWDAILKGLEMLRAGKVSGEKLVVRIPQPSRPWQIHANGRTASP